MANDSYENWKKRLRDEDAPLTPQQKSRLLSKGYTPKPDSSNDGSDVSYNDWADRLNKYSRTGSTDTDEAVNLIREGNSLYARFQHNSQVAPNIKRATESLKTYKNNILHPYTAPATNKYTYMTAEQIQKLLDESEAAKKSFTDENGGKVANWIGKNLSGLSVAFGGDSKDAEAERATAVNNLDKLGEYDKQIAEYKKNYDDIVVKGSLSKLDSGKLALLDDYNSKKSSNENTQDANMFVGVMDKTYTPTADYSAMQSEIDAKNKLKAALGDDWEKLAEYRKRQTDAENMQNSLSEIEADTAKHPALMSAASVAMAPAKVLGVREAINNYINDYGLKQANTNDPDFIFSKGSNTIRNKVMQDTNWNIGSADAFDFLYSTGMSMADSALGMATGSPAAGGALLGSQVMTDTIVDVTERGGTTGQAILTGAVAGAFESLFESVSIGQFKALKDTPINSILSKDGIKSALANIGKSTLVNASEETLTEIADIMLDTAVNGSVSDYATAIEQYMAQGMTEDEAKRKVSIDMAKRVLQSGASGALMGVGFGAAASGLSAVGGVAETVDTGKNLNNPDDLEELYQQTKKYIGDVKVAPAKSNNAIAIAAENYRIGNAYNKVMEKGASFAAASDASDYYQGVSSNDELDTRKLLLEKENNVDTAKAEQEYKTLAAMLPATKAAAGVNATEAILESPKVENAVQAPTEANTGISKEEQAIKTKAYTQPTVNYDGKGAYVLKVTKDDDGNAVLNLSNAKTVSVSDADISDPNVAKLYEAYGKYSYDAAKYFIAIAAKAKTNDAEFVTDAFQSYYHAGQTGDSIENVDSIAPEYSNVFPQEVKERIVMFGKNENPAVTKKQSWEDITPENAGDFVVDKSVKTNSLDKKIRSSLTALKHIAKATNTRIVAFSDPSDNSPNGYYKPETDTIYINIDGDYAVLQTAAHELTHFMRKHNEAGYQALKDYLLERYHDIGKDDNQELEILIEERKEMARRNKLNSRELSGDAALEEVVADACQNMLKDSNAIKELANKNPSLMKTIKKWLDDFVKAVKEAFSGVDANSKEYEWMKKTVFDLSEFQRMWDNVLVEAVTGKPSTDNYARDYLKNKQMAKGISTEKYNALSDEERAEYDAMHEHDYDDLDLDAEDAIPFSDRTLGSSNIDDNIKYSERRAAPPKKTVQVYKLMRLKNGELHPLFIDGAEPLDVGVWYDADSPNLDILKKLQSGIYLVNTSDNSYKSYDEYLKESGEKRTKYPSKEAIKKAERDGLRWVYIEDTENKQRRFGGEKRRYWNLGFNGSGSVALLSMRPGYHAGSLPTMRQIGKGANKDLRDDSFVWVVGEISADVNYQDEANKNPDKDIPTHLPTNGYYLKATNANKVKSQADKIGWYVSGSFKINRIISDSEAKQVIDDWNKAHPTARVQYDYARESGKVFDATKMRLVDEVKYSDRVVDSEGRELTPEQAEFFKDSKVRDENGNVKPQYHGTGRADRVGYTFDPNRATSGHMAFFTENKEIAENYARNKADTSIAYDSDYDRYETRFRVSTTNGKDMDIAKAWGYLTFEQRNKIKKLAGELTHDDDGNLEIIPGNTKATGGFDWHIVEAKGNVIAALIEEWLGSATLFNEEWRFMDVLNMTGVSEALQSRGFNAPYYKDPYYKEEKVYEAYLNIKNPFYTNNISKKDIAALRNAAVIAEAEYKPDDVPGDPWYKNDITPDDWINELDNDVDEGTSYSWTRIPDWVTDTLKTLGYDGIIDVGGKYTADAHQVAIPFFSNQIKSVDNLNPTGDDDIRYSDRVSRDSEYLAAVKSGDMETAQKIVDEAAEENGYAIKAYHGTAFDFTVFEREKIGSNYGADSEGFFFTNDYDDADGVAYDARINWLTKYGDSNDDYSDEIVTDNGVSEIVLGVYLKMDNPLVIISTPDKNGYAEISGYMDDNRNKVWGEYIRGDKNGDDYDGIIIKGDNTYKKSNNFNANHECYIVTDSSKIKSAAPATYKNNGDIIPLSKRFDATEDDIRYSDRLVGERAKELNKAKRKIKTLEETVATLEKGFKLTHGMELDPIAVNKYARKYLNTRGSKYGAKRLGQDLLRLYNQYHNGELSMEEMLNKGTAISEEIINLTPDAPIEEYAYILSEMRRHKFKLSETQKSEIKYRFGDMKTFQNAVFGTITYSADNDALELDSMWSELTALNPSLFPEDTVDADMPTVLVSAIDELKTTYNPYNSGELDFDDAAAKMALELFEHYLETPAYKSFADKAEERRLIDLAKLKNEYEQKLDKYKAAAKEAREATKAAKKAGQQKLKDYKAKQIATASKRKSLAYIEHNVSDLMEWIQHPKQGKSVPVELRDKVIAFLASFNFDSGKDVRRGNTVHDIRWQERTKDMLDYLSSVSDDSALFVKLDPTFVLAFKDFINSATVSNSTSLYDLDAESLEKIDTLVKMVKGIVINTNKTYAGERRAEISALANEQIRALDSGDHIEKRKLVQGKVGGLFYWDQMDSFTFFKFLGSSGEKHIFKNLRAGLDVQVKLLREAQSAFYEIVKDTDWKKWTGKEAKVETFDLEYGKIKLTTGQIMSLYLTADRDQGLGHILGGGINSNEDDINALKKIGRDKESREKFTSSDVMPTNITQNDLNKIFSVLKDEQMAVAKKLQKYLADTVSAWGNEVTQKMYLFNAYTEPKYWPIQSNRDFVASQDKDINKSSFWAIKNMSFAKALTKDANNPIIITDAFTVWADHVSGMATYNAYTLPLADAMRWYNYESSTPIGDGKISKKASVKLSMNAAYTKNCLKYYDNFIIDINGTTPNERGTELFKTLTSMTKTAAVGFSPSVAIQQPASYLRASVVIDNKYLVKAMKDKPNIALAKEYCPIAWWKSEGFFATDVGRDMRDLLLDDPTTMRRIRESSMWLAQKADETTWGILWNAVAYEIADKTDLTRGTEEFNKAVGERLSEVIDQTQVVDSVFHRSQGMRSKSQLLNSTVYTFFTEQNKSANVFMRAAIDSKRTKSAKPLAKATFAFIATTVIVIAAKSLVTAPRDDDEDETYAEKYLQALGRNAIENNPLTMIPGVNIVMSFIQGFDATPLSLSSITSAINAGKYMWNLYTKHDEMNPTELRDNSYKFIYAASQAASQATGIPMSNVFREFKSLYNAFADKNINSGYKVGDKYEVMRQAIISGDTETYDKTYARLKEDGKDDDTIQSGLKKAMKDNDPRIQQSAELKYSGNYDAGESIERELINEGFSRELVTSAVNSAFNAHVISIEGEEAELRTTALSGKYSELVNSVSKGQRANSYKSAQELKAAGTAEYIAEGMSRSEAEKKAMGNIRSSLTGKFKEQYYELKYKAYTLGDESAKRQLADMKNALRALKVGYDSDSFRGWDEDYYEWKKDNK